MSNYTPGPWHVIPHPKYPQGKSRIDNNSEASWGDFGQIAYVAPKNARLIAQAPNLLKIAEMVERVIQLGNATEDSDEALKQWFEAQEELGELVMETLKEVRGAS